MHFILESKRNLCFLITLASCIVLPACATNNTGTGTSTSADNSFVDGSSLSPISTDQVSALLLQPHTQLFAKGDYVKLSILQTDAISGSFLVNSNGKADFPFIGEVDVVGYTIERLQKVLKQRYTDEYLNDATVIVRREAALLGRIVIDGWVDQPGIYDIFNDITLQHAIAMVGGLKPDANANRVLLLRQNGGKRTTIEYSLNDIREKGAADPVIYAGDIIYVDNDLVRMTVREIIRSSPFIALFFR